MVQMTVMMDTMKIQDFALLPGDLPSKRQQTSSSTYWQLTGKVYWLIILRTFWLKRQFNCQLVWFPKVDNWKGLHKCTLRTFQSKSPWEILWSQGEEWNEGFGWHWHGGHSSFWFVPRPVFIYTIAICAVESPTIEDFGEVIGMTKQETDNLKLILVSVEQGDIGILHSLGIKVRFVLTPTDTRHDSTFCILSTMTLKVSIMQQEFICPLGLLLPLLA